MLLFHIHQNRHKMNGNTQLQNQKRKIIFKGQLQQKEIRKFGTLLRKKKAIYKDEQWVLLCVHEGGNGAGIPHLEWYENLASACDHTPTQVQDLLDCQYVNVAIGEERCMVIGFVDKKRPVLELSAPSVEERQQWVAKLTETLRQMNCLQQVDDQDEGTACCPRAENDYMALNELDELSANIPTSDDPSPYVPIVSMSTTAGQKLSLADTIPFHSSPPFTSNSPPFSPPRCGQQDNSRLQSSATTSNNEINRDQCHNTMPRQQSRPICIIPTTKPSFLLGSPQRSPENFIQESEEVEHLPPPLPPRRTHTKVTDMILPVLPSSPIPSSPPQSTYCAIGEHFSPRHSQYDRLNPTGPHQYQQLSRLSGEFLEQKQTASSSATTSTSNSVRNSGDGQQRAEPTISPRNSAQYDILSMPQLHQQFIGGNQTEEIFRESMTQTRRVFLSLSLLANVAFVDNGKNVWVAGWNPIMDRNLQNILHFGDELVKISGITIHSIVRLPEIYAKAKPGVQIEMLLRANDRAKVFTLIRPANPRRGLGITLHKRKNKIASIEPNSPADRAQIPARLPLYFYDRDVPDMPAQITELDGIPLNPYARNEQFFRRLEPVPEGTPINVTLHPGDFCVLIAKQLKAQHLDFRQYLHD